jgi:hypothetical protein
VAEGECFFVCSQFTNTANVVIIQVNVDKLLLFVHSAPVKKQKGRVTQVRELAIRACKTENF